LYYIINLLIYLNYIKLSTNLETKTSNRKLLLNSVIYINKLMILIIKSEIIIDK
jgi:hypothetical protein